MNIRVIIIIIIIIIIIQEENKRLKSAKTKGKNLQRTPQLLIRSELIKTLSKQ